ncbi:MAG: hypothetical protein ACLP6G_02120 [Terriglobales bacterium]
MKRRLSLALGFCSLPAFLAAQGGIYQHGTVVRMRMADCIPDHRGFMVAMGGQQIHPTEELCPEYTLVSDKVVFVIVGKSSNQMVPLAEVIDFRFHNNQMAVRIDDARRETRFAIKEMNLRLQWELMQKHIEEELRVSPRQEIDGATGTKNRE